MTHWVHPEAEQELGDAAVYYAEQASRRIAEAFIDEFERLLLLLDANQDMGTLAEHGLRVYPFRRFPYSVIYREHALGPRVYAVAHQHRRPGYWRERV